MSAPALGADISANGTLVFASDALATYGFESRSDLDAFEARKIIWVSGILKTSQLPAGAENDLLTSPDDALEGGHGLLVRQDLGPGIALRDSALISTLASQRFSISMWGRAYGAEPVLEVVYSHNSSNVGPGLLHVIALRTGRETSDGWAEYSTGPINGSAFSSTIRGIVLTARYATEYDTARLVDSRMSPDNGGLATILDPNAYAVVDAVEVRPEPGPAISESATCTLATADAACGTTGECQFGHCLDASIVWGPVPQAADHRTDLLERWAFVAQHLHGDRKATATAASTFAGIASLASNTSPRAYYGKLNELVSGLRDGHTAVGDPPSIYSVAYPLAYEYSGALDVCFGLAKNDLEGGENVFAVFAVASNPTTSEALQKGDVLTAIDGIDPQAWLAAVLPRFAPPMPNDPAADPSQQAMWLPSLVSRYAQKLTFSRCQSGGGCSPLPDIPIADEVFTQVNASSGYSGDSIVCSPRFLPSVSSPPANDAYPDVVVEESVGMVSNIQFNGFQTPYTTSAYQAWEAPWKTAVTSNSRVLVDARLGRGGSFDLGYWLFHLLRGTDQPYATFAMPRGAYDDPDPTWLFDASWDSCVVAEYTTDACTWTGGNIAVTEDASPLGGATKIAWVNGNDISMNDIVPRLLAGRANSRVFGPHPTQGAYGEYSALPAIQPSWRRGSLQVLDMRFGQTLADARAATWESGKGVQPDEVVVQTISDILLDHDTVLEAASAWVSQ